MKKEIVHYIADWWATPWKTACGRLYVGIAIFEVKRGVTCKTCRATWKKRPARK